MLDIGREAAPAGPATPATQQAGQLQDASRHGRSGKRRRAEEELAPPSCPGSRTRGAALPTALLCRACLETTPCLQCSCS